MDDALKANPFDGDFLAQTDRCLRSKIVIARKRRACDACGKEILPKDRIMTATYVIDGRIISYSWCSTCCNSDA